MIIPNGTYLLGIPIVNPKIGSIFSGCYNAFNVYCITIVFHKPKDGKYIAFTNPLLKMKEIKI